MRDDTVSREGGTGVRLWTTPRRALQVALATLILAATPAAVAAWTAPATGTGRARAVALGDGSAPAASVSGTTVELTWNATTLANGDPVGGYRVTRYDSTGTTPQVIVSGSCSSTVSGTTCSETATPQGTWKYSVTPTHEGWTGAESAKTTVTVGEPTLALSPTTTKSGTTLSGSIENFTAGAILRFRLDSKTGTELSGTVGGAATPTAVPLSGSASVTVNLPAGTSEGVHSIQAVVDLTGQSASKSVTVDDTPPPAPTLTSTPASVTSATTAEFAFTDSESGVAFECRIDAGSYASCSSPRSHTALTDGAHTFDVRAVDAAGNRSGATSFSWTVDTIAPTVTIDFPVAGSAYNNAGFNDGCGTASYGDVCGTTGSGAQDVRLSIRKGTGNYWDGTGFASATEVLFDAAGTTAWSYAFAGSNFPSDDTYTIRAVVRDAAGNSRAASTTFTIDRTSPAASDIQSANASGGTVGKAEAGDTITFTYSETIDPTSVLAGWDGSSTNVVVRINHRVTALLLPDTDILRVWNAANTAQLPLGQVDLGATDYVSANVTFGATGTPATMVRSGATITVALGTPDNAGAVTTAILAGAMTWTPSASARDLAGNGSLTTAVTESGSSDREF